MRHPFLMIVTAVQGGGKSYTTLKQILYQAYKSNFKRGALLFDTNGEYAEYEIDGKIHKIKEIKHNEIIRHGGVKEVKRVAPFHPNGMPFNPEEAEKLLIKVITEYRRGTLIIEDTNRIYGDALPQTVAGLLCNVRHRGCDVILHLQSVGRILPKMRQNTKIIRFHYQLDSIEDSKDKLAGEVEIYKIAEKLVNRQYEEENIRFFVYIYRETKKIKGEFSPRMFSEAIQEYISENEKCIRPLLMKKDAKGKKIYNYEEAINLKTHELFKKYYGN